MVILFIVYTQSTYRLYSLLNRIVEIKWYNLFANEHIDTVCVCVCGVFLHLCCLKLLDKDFQIILNKYGIIKTDNFVL